MIQFFRRNPLVWVAAALAFGIVCAHLTGGRWYAPGAFIAFSSVFLILRRRIACIASIACAIGGLAYMLGLPAEVDVDALNSGNLHLQGRVVRAEERTASTTMIVDVERIEGTTFKSAPANFRCQVITPQLFEAEAGDIVAFAGRFSGTESEVDVPDERTYEIFLQSERVSAICFSPPDSIRVEGHRATLLSELSRANRTIADNIVGSGLSDDCSAFLCALLTGDTSMLGEDVRQAFSSAGIAHVLALSGMHVGFIAIVVDILLFPLAMAGHSRWRWAITIILLWAYALMTGLSPSVVRAVTMATVYAIGALAQRDTYSLNSLALAAIVILMIWPMSLFLVGFQLSFMAVLGILAFARMLSHACRTRIKPLRWAADYAAVSVGAVLGSGPLCAYHFHQFPIIFIFTNIFIALLLPPFVILGISLAALTSLGAKATLLLPLLEWLYAAINWVVQSATSLPYANLTRLYFSPWLLIPIYLALGSAWAWMRTRRLAFGISTAALALFAVALGGAVTPTYPTAEAYLLRNHSYTTILQRTGNKAVFLTTMPSSSYPLLEQLAANRYADFLGKRRVEKVEMLTIDNAEPFSIADKTIVMVTSERDLCPTDIRPDILIVCRGFKGDILKLVGTVRPHKIILSADLNPRRRSRYASELSAVSIPCVVME